MLFKTLYLALQKYSLFLLAFTTHMALAQNNSFSTNVSEVSYFQEPELFGDWYMSTGFSFETITFGSSKKFTSESGGCMGIHENTRGTWDLQGEQVVVRTGKHVRTFQIVTIDGEYFLIPYDGTKNFEEFQKEFENETTMDLRQLAMLSFKKSNNE